MRTKLIGLIVGLVGCSAAFFCSCKKGCGISYVPEVLTDEQFSGAGYAQDFVPQEGELVFSVSSPSAANVLLTIRGLGKAEAEIVVNGRHGTVVFDDGNKWQEKTTSVHLMAGENSISILQTNTAESPLMIDYIEFEKK